MSMRVLVLGGDGYLGWPTSMHLSAHGHEVMAVDNYLRRNLMLEQDAEALFPIRRPAGAGRAVAGAVRRARSRCASATWANGTSSTAVFAEFRPEAIVHYAEQPSAPYSMLDRRAPS